MRIDARNGHRGWQVFDVPRCQEIRYVVWVDDDAHQYAAFRLPLTPDSVLAGPEVRSVRCVLIVPERRMVLIDPVDDTTDEAVSANAVEQRHVGAPLRLQPVRAAGDPAHGVECHHQFLHEARSVGVTCRRCDLHPNGQVLQGSWLHSKPHGRRDAYPLACKQAAAFARSGH